MPQTKVNMYIFSTTTLESTLGMLNDSLDKWKEK